MTEYTGNKHDVTEWRARTEGDTHQHWQQELKLVFPLAIRPA